MRGFWCLLLSSYCGRPEGLELQQPLKQKQRGFEEPVEKDFCNPFEMLKTSWGQCTLSGRLRWCFVDLKKAYDCPVGVLRECGLPGLFQYGLSLQSCFWYSWTGSQGAVGVRRMSRLGISESLRFAKDMELVCSWVWSSCNDLQAWNNVSLQEWGVNWCPKQKQLGSSESCSRVTRVSNGWVVWCDISQSFRFASQWMP